MKSLRTISTHTPTTTADWVARNLAAAPPLGDEQRRRLTALMNPVGIRRAPNVAA